MAFLRLQIDSKLNWLEQINALTEAIYVIRKFFKNIYSS